MPCATLTGASSCTPPDCALQLRVEALETESQLLLGSLHVVLQGEANSLKCLHLFVITAVLTQRQQVEVFSGSKAAAERRRGASISALHTEK